MQRISCAVMIALVACTGCAAANEPAPTAAESTDRPLPQRIEDIDREELIRLVHTPSPDQATYERLRDLFRSTRKDDPLPDEREHILQEHFRTAPPPSEEEKRAFLAKLKTSLIFVKGGRFVMGDFGTLTKYKLPISYGGDNPPHKVSLDSYSLMSKRVTYAEYDFFTRSQRIEPINIGDSFGLKQRYPDYATHPTTWTQANAYCRWLAEFTGQPFGLPTEAQWEYAARERGKFIAYPARHMKEVKWASEYIPQFATLDDALGARKRAKIGAHSISHPAGLYGANAVGMTDVIGSTYEWVADWYAPDYYANSPARNPKGPDSGTQRVVRPSAYGEYRNLVTRKSEEPDQTGEGMEFRCALNSPRPWK